MSSNERPGLGASQNLIAGPILALCVILFAVIGGVAKSDPINLDTGTIPDPPSELRAPISLTPQTRGIDSTSFISSRRQIGLFASTIAGDHEDAGFLTQGGGSYGGVVATHALYKNGEFQLALPPGATRPQTLYAPTTRAPNGSCLEVGTSYFTEPGQQTQATVYVFDFCAGMRFAREVLVDDNFIANYATTGSDGHRSYLLAITTNAPSPGISANWNASLFNYKSRQWDVAYSSTGLAADKRGWTIFKSWYQKGQCSKSLSLITAEGISYKDLADNKWSDLQPQMNHLTVEEHNGVSSNTTNTNCFHDDATGPASYKFNVVKVNSAWQVSSTGH